MEAIAQEQMNPFFVIGQDAMEAHKWLCPFCNGELTTGADPTIDGDILYCLNPDCSYTNQPTVREVVSALVESGKPLLDAAQIAALYTAEADDELEPVIKEKFAVTDMSSADWVLKKLAGLEAQLSNINAMVDNEIESIEVKRQKLTKPVQNQLDFFKAAFGEQLEAWTQQELKDKKTKSVNLLHGKVGFKKNPDKFIVDDVEAAITNAEIMEVEGAVKKTLSISTYKKWMIDRKHTSVSHNGVIAAHIEEGENTFYIKPEAL